MGQWGPVSRLSATSILGRRNVPAADRGERLSAFRDQRIRTRPQSSLEHERRWGKRTPGGNAPGEGDIGRARGT